jgi:hypothetical protein
MQCTLLTDIRTILDSAQPFIEHELVQVTSTKLGWTPSQTPVNFLLFSGEICSVLVTEF